MNEELIKNADAGYGLAEKKAVDYFKLLNEQVSQHTYIPTFYKEGVDSITNGISVPRGILRNKHK